MTKYNTSDNNSSIPTDSALNSPTNDTNAVVLKPNQSEQTSERKTVWVDSDGFLREFRTDEYVDGSEWTIVDDQSFSPLRVSPELSGNHITLTRNGRCAPTQARIDEYGFVRDIETDSLYDKRCWTIKTDIDRLEPVSPKTIHHIDGTKERVGCEDA